MCNLNISQFKKYENLLGKVQVENGSILCTLGEFFQMHKKVKISEQGRNIEFHENTFMKTFGYPKNKGEEFVPPWDGENFICYSDVLVNEIIEEDDDEIQIVIFDFFLERWEENSFYPLKPVSY